MSKLLCGLALGLISAAASASELPCDGRVDPVPSGGSLSRPVYVQVPDAVAAFDAVDVVAVELGFASGELVGCRFTTVESARPALAELLGPSSRVGDEATTWIVDRVVTTATDRTVEVRNLPPPGPRSSSGSAAETKPFDWGAFPPRAGPLQQTHVDRMSGREFYNEGVVWTWAGRGEPASNVDSSLAPRTQLYGETREERARSARSMLASGEAACWLRVQPTPLLGAQVFPTGGCSADAARRYRLRARMLLATSLVSIASGTLFTVAGIRATGDCRGFGCEFIGPSLVGLGGTTLVVGLISLPFAGLATRAHRAARAQEAKRELSSTAR